MDEEEDIKPDSDPGEDGKDGKDGYPKRGPFQDNDDNSPAEDDFDASGNVNEGSEDPEKLGQEAEDTLAEMEAAGGEDTVDEEGATDAGEPDQATSYHPNTGGTRSASIGYSPEVAEEGPPFRRDSEESPPPDFEEMDETSKSLESFGDKVNAFNDEGGPESSTPDVSGGDEEGGGAQEAMTDLLSSDLENRSQMKDMLIEHARRLDEMTRFLEAERL